MKYRIPVRHHRNLAKTKAEVAYVGVYGNGHKPGIAANRTAIVVVEAESHAEAYRKLCETYLPDDRRLIQGKAVIKYFRED